MPKPPQDPNREDAPPSPQPQGWIPPAPMPTAPTDVDPKSLWEGLQRLASDLRTQPSKPLGQLWESYQSASPGLGVGAPAGAFTSGASALFPRLMSILAMAKTNPAAFQSLVANPEHESFQLINKYYPKLADALKKNPRILLKMLDWKDVQAPKKDMSRGLTGLLSPAYMGKTGKPGSPVGVGMAFNPKSANLSTLVHEPEHAFAFGLGKEGLNRAYPTKDDQLRAMQYILKNAEFPGPTLNAYAGQGGLPHAVLEANAQRVARKISPMPGLPLHYGPKIYGQD